VVIVRGHGQRHVTQNVPGRDDVEDGEPGDGVGMIQRQPVRDAGTTVVADQAELGEAELAHEPGLVTGHGPLGVGQPGGIGSRLA